MRCDDDILRGYCDSCLFYDPRRGLRPLELANEKINTRDLFLSFLSKDEKRHATRGI